MTLLQLHGTMGDFVLQNSLKAAMLIALVLLVRRLLARHLAAQTRYLLWLPVVICLVTPVGITTTLPQLPAIPAFRAEVSRQADAFSETIGALLPAVAGDQEAFTQAVPEADQAAARAWEHALAVSFADVLALLWLGGALLFAAVIMVRQVRFARVVAAAVPVESRLRVMLEHCRHRAGCQRQVELLCSALIDAPLVTGIFRSRLLVPAGMARDLSDAQLRHVFLHELMHVKHHDVATNWLLALLQALHWFNPLVWLGFRHTRFDRELTRDAQTLQLLEAGEASHYGHTLIRLSHPVRHQTLAVGALGMAEDRHQLRKRVIMLVQSRLSARFQAAIGALCLLVFGAMAFSRPESRSLDPDLPIPHVLDAAVLTVGANQSPRISDAVLPSPLQPSVRTMTSAKTANAALIMTKAAVVPDPARMAVAAESVVMIPQPETAAIAETAAVAEPQPATSDDAVEVADIPAGAQVAVYIRTETYQDWQKILALARDAEAARDPAIKQLAEWNRQAVACGLRRSGLEFKWSKQECRDIKRALEDPGQIYSFRSRCDRFRWRYNKLSRTFVKAESSEFVDREAVGQVMKYTRRTIADFCEKETYRAKYPKVALLI
jgi:beta-lactamase regulating signal transducer with metallopeptidase domain